MIIQGIRARKILNSRREETIAVRVKTLQGTFEASAPAGASKGQNEVCGFSPKGVNFSASFINALGQKIVNERMTFDKFEDLEKIEEIYRKADKTKRLEILGGNSLYALGAAILKAIAASYKLELWQFLNGHVKPVMPLLLGNCIGGGKHTREIEKPDFQEFLILPRAKSEKVFDNQYLSLQAYKEVKKILKEKDKLFYEKITDENAFISSLDNEAILQVMQEVKKRIETKFRGTIDLGVDLAASSFYDEIKKEYNYARLNGKPGKLKTDEQIDYLFNLIKKYNLAYVEDPLNENDFQGFAKLLKKVKDARLNTLIVGDDLICTNHELLEKAIKSKSINAVIIKPNQCGSWIETKKVVDLAKKNRIVPIVSNRSGETCDDTIAHLAVGWNIPIIKIGIVGKERFAKTNGLVRIERKFGR
ncbi:MAG: phosphopyruvate hydratase [Candidatus Pacearchaeota archaeon]|nr:phosphopyruvate hydratase [Candidatus Pacearchaeota archaeon]